MRPTVLRYSLLAGSILSIAFVLLRIPGVGTAAVPTVTPTAAPTPIPAGASNDAWTPVYETINGIEMALVPVGCFRMGNDPASDTGMADGGEQCFEQPFWIGRTEVTNAQYAKCVAAGACEPSWWYADDSAYNGANQPVVGVSWFQAREYAAWLNTSVGALLPKGYEFRLPTEAEWEYAARGPEGRLYPWGDAEPTCDQANIYGCMGRTASVGSTSPAGDSWVGAADLAGNVWERTGTLYADYPYDAADGREDPTDASGWRVVRGGGWLSPQLNARAASRLRVTPEYGNDDLGFRVVCGCAPAGLCSDL